MHIRVQDLRAKVILGTIPSNNKYDSKSSTEVVILKVTNIYKTTLIFTMIAWDLK